MRKIATLLTLVAAAALCAACSDITGPTHDTCPAPGGGQEWTYTCLQP